MRTRAILGIGAAVAIVIAVVGWKSCAGSSDKPGSTTAKTVAQQGDTKVSRRGKQRGPVVPATLSGRVTRASDGAGVAGAKVSIAPAELMAMFMSSESPTIVAVTDASGAWTATGVMPGAHVVAASAAGFLPASRPKLVVASGEQRSGVDLALAAGGTIVRGTVTDVGGGPIADARITATIDRNIPDLSGRADFVTTSGADGRYELTLADGEYDLSATHDDYSSDREDVEVAGDPVTADFTLVPGAVIRGQVIARDSGDPVPGALVLADDHGRAIADAGGNFTLRALEPGSIELKALARGYASATPTVVPVGIGEQVEDVRVLLDRAYSISGRVVRKGKPSEGLPGVTLGAFSIAAKTFGVVLEPSDNDGAFDIVGLRPGSYTLFAVGEGSVPDVGKNVEIVDKDVDDVVVELDAGVTIAGRVEPARPDVAISISPDGQFSLANMFEYAKSLLVHAQTDAGGAFVLRNVPAGSFSLNAKARDGYAGTLPLQVADRDQTGLVVKLEARASVAGKVIDTSGKPVAKMQVEAAPLDREKPVIVGDGGRARTTSGADGSFKLVGLEAGKYRLRASGDDDRFEFYIVGAKSKAVTELQLAATETKTGITLTVEARDAVIRGTVVGADRKPVPDSWVTARRELEKLPGQSDDIAMKGPKHGGDSAPVLTNGEGQFTISRLRRGTYNVVVTGPRGASRAEKSGVKTGDNVTIQLAQLGTLTGKVTAGGAPVTKYDLECEGPADDSNERRVEAADGAYSLERLAPGAYTCNVDSDVGTATGKVDVPSGPATLDFALTRWASVTGVLVSLLDKRPVSGVNVFAGADDGAAFSTRNIGDLVTGKAPVSDASGRFTLPRVAPGNGKVAVIPKDGFMPLATRDYTAVEGQRIDLGTIEIVPPRTGDAGTFGFATNIDGDKLVVTSVKEGGPAAVAGMQVGDRVVSINGRDIASLKPELAQTLIASGTVGVGQQVQLALDRAGAQVAVTLVSVKW